MNEPVLVVMAAGMGSRYGGLKQIDPMGKNGEVIMDYSIYDALKAGFKKVIFIIKREIEADFRAVVGDRIAEVAQVSYAYQEVDDLPAGYTMPEGRTKPWGTSQAILSTRDLIDGPFAVVNADDYYGPHAFQVLYDYLSTHQDQPGCYEYCMVGYQIENTLTEHGTVARGVCAVDENGFLQSVTERTKVAKDGAGAKFTEDEGASWTHLEAGTPVSMNLWGFHPSMIREIEKRFPLFLDKALSENPLKAEFYLPTVVSELLQEKKARVKVLQSPDKWYGVTYQADKPVVQAAMAKKHTEGQYPEPLWKK
ncbi:MAG: sugar phosphate nucleotidyltransferase [Oscillospiraceae bacterium]|nr:sugar phosphate nucleotidyltransferase [Oscillospiraceae bacterium]